MRWSGFLGSWNKFSVKVLVALDICACPNTGLYPPAMLRVAQIELSFLLAKESVHVCSENTVDIISSNKIFTVVQVKNASYHSGINDMFQEYFVRLTLMFLNTCPHFQSLPAECKAALLR